MNKALTKILLYLVVPALLMLATGSPQTVYRWCHEHHPSVDHVFTDEELKTLKINPENFFAYCNQVYKVREHEIDNKGVYEPTDYFHDLKQLEMFRVKYADSLSNDRKSIAIVLSISSNINRLAGLRDNNWRKYPLVDREKINEARGYWFPIEKQRDLESAKFAAEFRWINVVTWFLNWFFRFYLQGMPAALILFLIWKFKLKKDFDEEFRWDKVKPQMYFGVAPFSFFVSLALWPIVLGIDIYNKFEDTFRRADVISRRGKMLSLFSKQEEQLLELGKKMSRVEFREHLDSIGMVQKHSFASALLVTLFLIIVPASLFSQTSIPPISKEKVIIMKSDYGGGGVQHYAFVKQPAMIADKEEIQSFPTFTKIIFYITDWLYEYVFVPDIGKVPLELNRFAIEII